MRKKGIPVMNIGISLIILVFISLCLLTFSVLSLENAVADYRLSKKAAEHTADYYEAVNQINGSLRDTQNVLEQLWKEEEETVGETMLFSSYKAHVLDAFLEKGICEETEEGDVEFIYEQSVSKQQALCVRARLTQSEDGKYYDIISWKLESNGEWEADNSLNVYQGVSAGN